MNDAPGYSTAMPGFSGGFGVPGGGGSSQQQGVNPQAGLQQGSNRNGVGLGLPSGLMVSISASNSASTRVSLLLLFIVVLG
jgi:hypothetical protein